MMDEKDVNLWIKIYDKYYNKYYVEDWFLLLLLARWK